MRKRKSRQQWLKYRRYTCACLEGGCWQFLRNEKQVDRHGVAAHHIVNTAPHTATHPARHTAATRAAPRPATRGMWKTLQHTVHHALQQTRQHALQHKACGAPLCRHCNTQCNTHGITPFILYTYTHTYIYIVCMPVQQGFPECASDRKNWTIPQFATYEFGTKNAGPSCCQVARRNH